MRRAEKEITDQTEIIAIIAKCGVCRLGLSDQNIPYVVPMNYGYEYKDNKLILYFHGAKEGKKLEIIRKNPVACFEMDCSHQLITGPLACNYTMEYESVIGHGHILMCDQRDEKIKALQLLMQTYAKDKTFDFPDTALDAVCIFKLEVSHFTGKHSRTKKSETTDPPL